MTEEELKRRTKDFALRVIRLVEALPNTSIGRNISSQIVRSGTSVAANYRAACRGRSRADFAAKLAIVEEEADESAFWLELIIDAQILKRDLVVPLLQEADELTRIFASSAKSAKLRPNPP